MKFKNYSSPNKERTLSNDWKQKQHLDNVDEIEDIVDDIYDEEEETEYADIENKEDDFDLGLPDSLDDQNKQINQKFPRRNSLVDYGHKGIMTYNAFNQNYKSL